MEVKYEIPICLNALHACALNRILMKANGVTAPKETLVWFANNLRRIIKYIY
jgi:hypothetical protein